ncbi:FecR family protein [Nitrobacter sp.]|uniref:FecR family protein n=1 Tax=Nitrobacter sp. TaxID=29420 RepID=UPI001D771256|nr:FecR family protein [Nitrobacter sp.]MCB1394172.1 FecR family protein [Nitrobacter sp.]MCV0386694.1 FecR family protein [Nitrobacter sp.]
MTAEQSARARRKRHEEAAAWVLKNRDSNQSAHESRAFEEWLDRGQENRTAYEAAERLMGEARAVILNDPALRNFKVKPRPRVAKTLAVAILGAALVGGAFVYSDGPMRLLANAISGTGEMPTIELADGTTIQLNAFSAVSYRFTAETRTVTLLRGQAFFQVAKDANRPFVVEANGGRTTALGTAFDVRLDPNSTEVTVTEHAVSVTSHRPAAEPAVRVNEGQQAIYDRDGKVKDVRQADTHTVLAWRRGQLVVDNALLADVVTEIGRHFAGRIIISNSDLAARRVSGTFTVTDTDAALALLRESLGVSVIRMGPLILLRG